MQFPVSKVEVVADKKGKGKGKGKKDKKAVEETSASAPQDIALEKITEIRGQLSVLDWNDLFFSRGMPNYRPADFSNSLAVGSLQLAEQIIEFSKSEQGIDSISAVSLSVRLLLCAK